MFSQPGRRSFHHVVDPQEEHPMLTTSRKTLTAIATVSALAAGGATLAGAAATNSSSSSSSERSQRPAQTALTGEAAVKVRAAAQEKVPDGTVLRVEEGGPESSKYHAHVRRSDGTMLARLEEAFAERRASEERLRRLLTDASHELRTPLASICGYAELFRIGAAAQPQDVAKAMTRIEDESARMGVLVEDLLALAHLDEVREQIREPVDLRELAADAVDDARAVAPDRTISLQGEEAVVDGDPGQLRQVLANLMRNALVHTPPGTPIEVTVGTGDGDATLTVRDHGPGLPTDDPSELSYRFWRADPGRVRGRAGAGLGLAIVAGVVSAHGGRAAATDALGGGARFEIVLALRAA